MIEYLFQVVAAQAGLNPLESPALFNDLLDDAPTWTSLREIENYWWDSDGR